VDAVIFVEVLDRRGHVTQRVRLDALPVTLGRSYRNAVIVDDRYVSPEHIRIAVAETGGVIAEDLDSENGLYEEPSGVRVTRVPVQPGTRLRVGHTVLRFAAADQPMAPTVMDPFVGRARRLVYSRRATALILAAALLLSMLTSYFTSYDQSGAASRLSDALMLGAALAAWAGGWALVTRILQHRFAFGPHLAIAAGVLLGAEVVNGVVQGLDVVESGTTAAGVWQSVLIMLAIAAALYGHLTLAAPLAAQRRLVWSLGVSATLVGLVEFAEFAERDSFDGSPSFAGAVRPVGGAANRGISLDAFMDAAAELQQRVDQDVRSPSN
jgi:hypothetical protein